MSVVVGAPAVGLVFARTRCLREDLLPLPLFDSRNSFRQCRPAFNPCTRRWSAVNVPLASALLASRCVLRPQAQRTAFAVSLTLALQSRSRSAGAAVAATPTPTGRRAPSPANTPPAPPAPLRRSSRVVPMRNRVDGGVAAAGNANKLTPGATEPEPQQDDVTSIDPWVFHASRDSASPGGGRRA